MKSFLQFMPLLNHVKEISYHCKNVIYSQFSFFSEISEKTEIDYHKLNVALKNKDEITVQEITEQTLSNAFKDIEKALENLTDPKLQLIINGSQMIALLSFFMATILQSQNLDKTREELKRDLMSTITIDETYQCLILGTLDTIYSLSVSKEENKMVLN